MGLQNIIYTEISSRRTLLQDSTYSLNSAVVEVAYRKGNSVFFLSIKTFGNDKYGIFVLILVYKLQLFMHSAYFVLMPLEAEYILNQGEFNN